MDDTTPGELGHTQAVYDDLRPSEAQLRTALAALGVPVPPELEEHIGTDPVIRAGAIAAHLRRAATTAARNLMVSNNPGEMLHATSPQGWPIPEQQWCAVEDELSWAFDRLTELLSDQTDGAVRFQPAQGEEEHGRPAEAHALAAFQAVDAARTIANLRQDHHSTALTTIWLDTAADRIDESQNAVDYLNFHYHTGKLDRAQATYEAWLTAITNTPDGLAAILLLQPQAAQSHHFRTHLQAAGLQPIGQRQWTEARLSPSHVVVALDSGRLQHVLANGKKLKPSTPELAVIEPAPDWVALAERGGVIVGFLPPATLRPEGTEEEQERVVRYCSGTGQMMAGWAKTEATR